MALSFIFYVKLACELTQPSNEIIKRTIDFCRLMPSIIMTPQNPNHSQINLHCRYQNQAAEVADSEHYN